jgi:hypothetical protein
MNEIFIKLGVLTEQEVKEIDEFHLDIDQLSEQLIQELEKDYKSYKNLSEQYTEAEYQKITDIKKLVESDEFQHLKNNCYFNKKINAIQKSINEDEFWVLKSKGKLNRIYNAIEDVLNQYQARNKNKSELIKKNIGNKVWDEYAEKFTNPVFLNMLDYYEANN